jgi:hypothetical protein
MPREITDAEGITWTCIQAYAGLEASGDDDEAAPAAAKGKPVDVICTPSGGARSVRLTLAADWEASVPDEDLLARVLKGLRQPADGK